MDQLPIWTAAEQAAYLKQPHRRYFCGSRNKAISLLMLRCGLRVSEAVGKQCNTVAAGPGGLRVRDVDLDSGRISIREAKDTRKKRTHPDGTPVRKRRGAGRVVFADGATREALREWSVKRTEKFGDKKNHPDDFFFLSHTGRQLDPVSVREFMATYADRAGVPREKAHPHALRHTFATEFLQTGGSLLTLQKILGHHQIAVTALYLHATEHDVRAAMQERPFTLRSEA